MNQLKYEREIFVFGSNRQGRHGKGAALTARNEYGAVYGQPRGHQGNSYAIVTKELRNDFPVVTLVEIQHEVNQFLDFAKQHPNWLFRVTPVGCGLAGFDPQRIAPLFVNHTKNVQLPQEFIKFINARS